MRKEPSLNSLCELVNLQSKRTKYYNALYDTNNNVAKIDKLIQTKHETRIQELTFESVDEATTYLNSIIDYQRTEQ